MVVRQSLLGPGASSRRATERPERVLPDRSRRRAARDGSPHARPSCLRTPTEAAGVNDRLQLARVEKVLRARINDQWLARGVTMWNPAETYVDADVELAPEVSLLPGTVLKGHCVISRGAQIGPNAVLERRGGRRERDRRRPSRRRTLRIGSDARVAVLHGARVPVRTSRRGNRLAAVASFSLSRAFTGTLAPWRPSPSAGSSSSRAAATRRSPRTSPRSSASSSPRPTCASSPTARSTAASTSRSAARTSSSCKPTPRR